MQGARATKALPLRTPQAQRRDGWNGSCAVSRVAPHRRSEDEPHGPGHDHFTAALGKKVIRFWGKKVRFKISE